MCLNPFSVDRHDIHVLRDLLARLFVLISAAAFLGAVVSATWTTHFRVRFGRWPHVSIASWIERIPLTASASLNRILAAIFFADLALVLLELGTAAGIAALLTHMDIAPRRRSSTYV